MFTFTMSVSTCPLLVWSDGDTHTHTHTHVGRSFCELAIDFACGQEEKYIWPC